MEVLDAVTYPAVLTELAGDRWAGPGLGSQGRRRGPGRRRRGPGRDRPRGQETVVAWAAQTKFAARGRGARPAVGAVRAKIDMAAAPDGRRRPRRRGQGRRPARYPARGPVLVQAKDEAVAAAAGLRAGGGRGGRLPAVPDRGGLAAGPAVRGPARARSSPWPCRSASSTRPRRSSTLTDLQALRDVLGRFLRPGGAK
ncbi:MAG: hypothetical protein M0C28_06845 [Candidatus Moduliflexus flocculans]|nr:hypothetical protein [Candidatus Moduliflexus flocculans]